MNSDQLKYFISAAECLNFSEVARSNYVSQPTISHQISLLEQELGVELFFRQGKKLHLSKEGEFFLPIASKISSEMQDASLDITRYKQGKTGRVSVFVAETCRTAYWHCLSCFSKQNPDIMLDTDVNSWGMQIDNIINGNYDVCFVMEKSVKGNEQFDYIVTQKDMLCLVLPESFSGSVNINDFSSLEGLPFIGINTYNSPTLQSDLRQVFLSRNFNPQISSRYNRMEEALMSVEAGIGFSILPLSIIQFYSMGHIKYFPFEEEELCVPCVAAWRKDKRNRSADAFVSVIKDIYCR